MYFENIPLQAEGKMIIRPDLELFLLWPQLEIG